MKFSVLKRSLVLLAFVIMAAVLPVCAAHADTDLTGEFGDGFTWTLTSLEDARILTITGTGDMPDWESVGEVPWYKDTHNIINRIVVSDGVTSVGSHAFERAEPGWSSDRVEVKLPASVTRIGDYAFYRLNTDACSCPANVKEIGAYAFSGIPAYSVNLPSGLEKIGDYAFSGCVNLYDVRFPASLRYLGTNAFKNCGRAGEDDVKLVFQGSAPSSGDEVFAGVTGLAFTPAGDKSWTAAAQNRLGGSLTWYQSGAQTITTRVKSSVKKYFGAKAFSLGAKTTGDGTLTYNGSNSDVASVDKNGKVTIKGVGKTTITITASGTRMCKAATRKINLTVLLKGTSLKSVKKTRGPKLKIRWTKNNAVTGYQIQYAVNKAFTKKVKKITIRKKSVTAAKTKKLKKKKTYYVRVRTFKKVQKVKDDLVYTKTYYSGWSNVKSARVK